MYEDSKAIVAGSGDVAIGGLGQGGHVTRIGLQCRASSAAKDKLTARAGQSGDASRRSAGTPVERVSRSVFGSRNNGVSVSRTAGNVAPVNRSKHKAGPSNRTRVEMNNKWLTIF